MSRISLTQKYYKEDCLNMIQNLSILQLQEVLDINLNDKREILDFLNIGLKKEDLNFCLANSLKIIDNLPFREELLNKQKHKKTVGKDYLEYFVTNGENNNSFHTRDENKSSFHTREKNIEQILPPETRIFKYILHTDANSSNLFQPQEENNITLQQVENYPKIPPPKLTTDFLEENSRNLWNTEDAEIDCIEYNTEVIDNQFNDFIVQVKQDIHDGIDESIKQIQQINNNSTINLQQLVNSKSKKYQIIQSLNERNNQLKKQKDIFQFTMKQLLKNNLKRYEREKTTFFYQDSNYKFLKNTILPLCNQLNINYDELKIKIGEDNEKRKLERIQEIYKNHRKK